MELHHLRYVLALAKHLHFSRTAAELNITQPSLSQSILQVEQEFGVKLFERKTRSVKLTASGEEFVMYAAKVLADMEQLRAGMRKWSALQGETLRIGTLLNMARLELNARILSVQREHPLIRIAISELLGSIELIRQLEADVFDIVFFMPAPDLKVAESLTVVPVLNGHVVTLVPRTHRLATRHAVTIKDLAEEPLIFPARSHSMFGLLSSVFRSHGIEPRIVAQISHVETGLELAAKGVGICLASSPFVDPAKCRDVVPVPVEPRLARNISMAYDPNSPKSAAIGTFRDAIVLA